MEDIRSRQMTSLFLKMKQMRQEISYVEKRLPPDRPPDPEQLMKLVTVAQLLIKEVLVTAGIFSGFEAGVSSTKREK